MPHFMHGRTNHKVRRVKPPPVKGNKAIILPGSLPKPLQNLFFVSYLIANISLFSSSGGSAFGGKVLNFFVVIRAKVYLPSLLTIEHSNRDNLPQKGRKRESLFNLVHFFFDICFCARVPLGPFTKIYL